MWRVACAAVFQAVMALKEVSSPLPCVDDMLLYCSFCNENFSMIVLKHIMVSRSNTSW